MLTSVVALQMDRHALHPVLATNFRGLIRFAEIATQHVLLEMNLLLLTDCLA